MDDSERLQRFVAAGDDTAFGELVAKYHRLAFSAALRRAGSRPLAEEATQNAFTILARKAKRLIGHPTLAGWLHRTAMLEASTLARAENTRERKHNELLEREVTTTATPDPTPPAEIVDEALAKLEPNDRDILLLRYYEELSFAEIALRLDKNEATCQKRSKRAVKKLSSILQRQGIGAPSAAALSVAFTTQLVEHAPAASAVLLGRAATANAGGVATGRLISNTLQTMSHTKTIAAGAVTLCLLIPIASQSKQIAAHRKQIADTRDEIHNLREDISSGTSARIIAVPAQLERDGEPLTAIPPRHTEDSSPDDPVKALHELAVGMGEIKREEVRLKLKYKGGKPTPTDPAYAEYVADMDAFMRTLGSAMGGNAGGEDYFEEATADEKATFVGEVVHGVLDLDHSQRRLVESTLSEALQGDAINSRDERPEEAEAAKAWDAERAEQIGVFWDRIDTVLTEVQRENFGIAFPREEIVHGQVGINLPMADAALTPPSDNTP